MKKLRAIIMIAAALPVVLSAERDFTVRVDEGVPRLVSQGSPVPQRLYMANPIHLPTAKLAVDSGVSLFQIVDYHLVWEGQPESDFEKFDSYLDTLLAVDPTISVIPRIKLDDRKPPFLDQHPECIMRLEDGTPVCGFNKNTPIASIAHPLYRAEIAKAMRRTIRHLEEKYGDRIAGYHPAYGNGSEWQYWHYAKENQFNGYDIGTRDAFRNWLKNKYRSNEALADAWRKPGLTFDQVTVPSVKERRGKGEVLFHDPDGEQNVIDFNLFQNENMADGLLAVARVIREEVGHRKLSCAFYGYTFECSATFRNGPAVSGHNALRKLLDSPDVDVLMAPFSYLISTRSLGGGAATHAPSESISNAGKLWLNEDDNSTFLAVPDIRNGKFLPDGASHCFRTLEESLLIYRRNLAFNYLRNYAGWWMDLYGKQWQNDSRLWQEMTQFQPLEKKLQQHLERFQPDLALLIDENSMNYFVSANHPFRLLSFATYEIRDFASRSSVTYGQYLLSDVLLGRKVDSKVDIHCASVALSGKDRELLRLRADQKPTIWLLAPGLIDLDRRKQSAEAMKSLTGFTLKPAKTRELRVRSTGEGMFFGLPWEFGGYRLGGDPFGVEPGTDDVVLARFADGTAAVVYRPAKDGKASALFCGTNALPPVLIRQMAKDGGAKIWCEEDLHVQANASTAAFTAPHSGAFSIDTGWHEPLRNVLTGESLGTGPKILCELSRGDTLIVERVESEQ